MSEENLGSGQFLDQSLDLEVGSTGDIKTVSGREELEKDLAFQMIFSLEPYTGQPPTPEIEAEVKRIAYRVAIADVRVTAVDRENITVNWNTREKELDATVPVTTTTDEQYDLVFNV
jgi:hypothetical protein